MLPLYLLLGFLLDHFYQHFATKILYQLPTTVPRDLHKSASSGLADRCIKTGSANKPTEQHGAAFGTAAQHSVPPRSKSLTRDRLF